MLKKMKFLKVGVITALLLFAGNQVMAQDTLNVKYQDMIRTTETFNQFKVIPRTTIDAFWSEVVDSLTQNATEIKSLKSEVSVQKDSLKRLSSTKRSLQGRLDESLNQKDSIRFLGMDLSKTTYHIIVWGIIIAVAILAVVFYLMFIKGNRVTTRSKKELEELQVEFEEHKNKARESQVKLKRELQTAVNKLEELKRGRG